MSIQSILMLPLEQQLGIATNAQLVCFFISIEKSAEGIYYALETAVAMKNDAKQYNYNFCYMGQCKVYTGCQITELYRESNCFSLNDLLANSDDLDGVVRVLFKLRLPLTSLYAAYPMALNMKGRRYFYVFQNPLYGLPNAYNLGLITGTYKMNVECIIRTFECCQFEAPPICNVISITFSTTVPNIGSPNFDRIFLINDLVPITIQLIASNGVSPFTWFSESSLPPGLNLDMNTGLISGAATVVGNYASIIFAVDSVGCFRSVNYAFVVA